MVDKVTSPTGSAENCGEVNDTCQWQCDKLKSQYEELQTQRAELEAQNERLRLANQALVEANLQIEDHAVRLEAIQSIADAGLSRLPMEELLQELLNRLRKVLASDITCILMLDKKQDCLTVSACSTNLPGLVAARVPVGRGVAGRIAADRQAIIIDDLSAVEVLSPALKEHIHTLVGAPLVAEDRLIGVVYAGRAGQRSFSEDDKLLLQIVADRMALAIDNTRLLEEAQYERERWFAAVDSMPNPVTVGDAEGHAIYMNPTYSNLIRRKIQDGLAIKEHAIHYQLYHPDGTLFEPEDLPLQRAALRNEVVKEVEIVQREPDGTEKIVVFSGSPLHDRNERVIGSVAVGRDITEQRRAEEALRKSEEWFRLITTSCPDIIFVQDLDLRYTFVVNSLKPRGIESTIGLTDFDLYPAHQAEELTRVKREILKSGTAKHIEVQLNLDKGKTVWMDGKLEPWRDKDGRVIGVFGYARETTERKKAETERETLIERISALADISSALLQVENPRTFVNGVFDRLSGPLGLDMFFNYMVLGDGPSMELNAFGGVPPEVGGSIKYLQFGQAVCGCVARDGKRIIAKHIQYSKDPRADLVRSMGVQCYVCHPLMSSAGRVMGTLSFGTKRKPRMDADEIELLRTVCDYVAIAFERADTRDAERNARTQAQEAVKARDAFLSIASHELRTPVTSLLGFSQLALRRLDQDGALDVEKARKTLEIIEQQSRKLATLISQLLDVSRIESGRLVLEKKETDLVELLERIAATTQLSTTEHAITLTSPSALIALVDPLRLEQVLTNLIDNAIKYSQCDGEIQLSVAQSNGRIQLAVRDHGPGIPPEHRDKVFDRFYQVEQDKRGGGMGLGLSISKQIAELHGGELTAEFPDDGGTRFVVTLPAS